MNQSLSSIKGPEPEYIKNLFGSIAPGYDGANDFMTWGLARYWRKKLVTWSEAKPGQAVLDCATGTGDLACDFKRRLGDKSSVFGIDFCPEMLAFAPQKAKKENLEIDFQVADVTNLPFDSNRFDVVSIAYGIRNVGDPKKALQEMARVTRPTGTLMILETGNSATPIVSPLIRTYFEKVVPLIGGLMTGQPDAYRYLNNSSGGFPAGEDFTSFVSSTKCFSRIEYKSLMGGASYLYKCRIR